MSSDGKKRIIFQSINGVIEDTGNYFSELDIKNIDWEEIVFMKQCVALLDKVSEIWNENIEFMKRMDAIRREK